MSGLLPLEDAQRRLIALANPLPHETVDVADALGQCLVEDLRAKRKQPAADMSAMDGYAIRYADNSGPWTLIGECKAGSPPCRDLKKGETARIFTGALLPRNADTVIMQENVNRNNDIVTLTSDTPFSLGRHVRHAGSDFNTGDTMVPAGKPLSAADLGQSVIAGYSALNVRPKTKIAIVSTGDELVEPGAHTLPHQIPASNDVMVSSMLESFPTECRSLSRIPDNMDALCKALISAQDSDIIVTIGGASVGDHDLVAPALKSLGAEIDFWKIAIKPGKPLMAGRLGSSIILALPGNPGSAFVTATLFLLPLVRYLNGANNFLPQYLSATTTSALPPTMDRTQFLRAVVDKGQITAFNSQDSAKLSILSKANALLMRPANAEALPKGAGIEYIPI